MPRWTLRSDSVTTDPPLSAREREFVRQLIDLRLREEAQLREIDRLKEQVKWLKEQVKKADSADLKKRLDHALAELAVKKQRPMLSNEEWQLVKDFRGMCG